MPRLESQYSSQVSAMAGDTLAPGQVTGLAYTVAQGQVILTWNAVTLNSDGSAISDLSGYRIFRKKNVGDAFASLGTVASGVTTYTDLTAKDGASYIYAVAAFDDESVPQEGTKSADLAVKTIPSVPTGLATVAADAKITVSWTSVKDELDTEKNENLAGYAVYRSEVSGSGYANIGEVNDATTSFDDNTAVNGTTYYYVVTAFDDSI